MHSLPFLLEILVEELPSSFVHAALKAFPSLWEEVCITLRLTHSPPHAYGSPRRLALYVKELACAQEALHEEVVGPPESIAFQHGKPTKAAHAFATKLHVPMEELILKPCTSLKGSGCYLVGHRHEEGMPTETLLGPALAFLCSRIPFRISMRWGNGDVAFGRPVQGIVALFGEHILPFTFAGHTSTRTIHGHRFLAPEPQVLRSPHTYLGQLREAHVIVDHEERKEMLLQQLHEAATRLGATWDQDAELLEENTSLVEKPHVLVGSFDPSFLALPTEVIRAVARGHQKYFCVNRPDGTLLPHYLLVANTANCPDNILQGNNRVMHARLSDARFFFEEDQKHPLEARVPQLDGIIFHHRLGSIRKKTERIEALAHFLAQTLGLPAAQCTQVMRAARLCKTDLVSLMVGEFPELQGVVGEIYATRSGEDLSVAQAIREHYRPLSSADAPPVHPVSVVLSLADRLDTLAGCFAIGLIPTGTADPYALRRACLGLLRTLLDRGAESSGYAELNLSLLFETAYALLAPHGQLERSQEDTVTALLLFAKERLRGLLAPNEPVLDAVFAGMHHVHGKSVEPIVYPAYTACKANVLQAIVETTPPWFENVCLITKRLHGICSSTKPVLHSSSSFSEAAMRGIACRIQELDITTQSLTYPASIHAAFATMVPFSSELNLLFDTILVNNPSDPATQTRLELLAYGSHCLRRLGDLSRINFSTGKQM